MLHARGKGHLLERAVEMPVLLRGRQIAHHLDVTWIAAAPVSYTHLTLPTSDLGVDLGGRRIIKKKKPTEPSSVRHIYTHK